MSASLKLRPPNEVMRLARLGAFFPHRLSFMRCFIRRIAREKAELTIPIAALDADGFGHIVLTLLLGGRAYSLIAYSRPLDDSKRTDRVIATQWDASFCLYDGVPNQADISRLEDEVTRQEAGRYHHKVLTLSRANKSLRLFQHVVERLASGKQPDPDPVKTIGYLMRTTAVYGNGKFGIADRARIETREGLTDAFQVEMLTVFLIREFTFFLADYCAAQKSEEAVKLAPHYRRYLGIGNSTGLGMAPFLVNHPRLIHSWIYAREMALTKARVMPKASQAQRQRFSTLLTRAQKHSAEWQVEDSIQMQRIRILREELTTLNNDLKKRPLAEKKPFADAYQRCQNMSAETQEMMVSLLLEMGTCAGDTSVCICAHAPDNNQQSLNPAMQVGELKAILGEHYAWVDDIDCNDKESDAQFWYTSEEKLEPRLGQRYIEPGHELEMPFNIPKYVRNLKQILAETEDQTSIAELLIAHPNLRYMIRRAQTTAQFPYAEIRDNLVAATCRPIDLLRCKLAFFGASKFDPKSDRWTRIALFQGAPTAADLQTPNPDDWLFALFPNTDAEAKPC